MIAAKNGSECLLVKTASEIALKSPFVRKFFTKKLVQSIKFALKRNGVKTASIIRGGGRLYVFCSQPKKAQKIISRVSGIHAIAVAEHFQFKGYEEIESQVVSFAAGFLKKGDSFALDVGCVNSKPFSGRDLERKLGAAIQKEIPCLTVNLTKPEKEIFIELRKKSFFVYTEQQKCLGGLPLGVEGSVAFLFEGKKEELLAAFLLMHRGCNLFPIVKKKSKALEKHLKKLVPFNDYRKFILTEEKNLSKLIEERKIKAIATPDCKVDEKSLVSYRAFDAAQSLVVLRPLLLYPEESRAHLETLFH